MRRVRAAGRGEIIEIGANATESSFVAFIIALLGRFHASSTPATPTQTHTNPLKSTTHALHAHELTNTEKA